MRFPTPTAAFRYPVQVFGLLMVQNLILRAMFFAYNYSGGGEFSGAEALTAFVVGFRFDAAAVCLVAGIPLVFLGLPTGMTRRWMTFKVANIVLVVLNLLMGLLNTIDIVYYSFASKRTTHELFTTKGDLANFGPGEILPYSWLLLVWLALSYLLYRFLNRYARKELARRQAEAKLPWWHWGLSAATVALLFIGIRGGLQLRPIRPANAFVTSSFFLGNVSLNSTFTVIQSIDIGKERPVDFMPDAEAIALAQKLFHNDFDGGFVAKDYPLVRKAEFEGEEKRHNVVLLIIESFNAQKIGTITGKGLAESLTPNFDTLAKHGVLFTNFYSNGSRSVESLPAILNSMPDIFKRPVIGSSFETNAHWGLGNILNSRGYHSSFFCGGENGTMGFDSYSRVSGFQHYYGRNEFPANGSGPAGKWGVHDRPYLNWIGEMQSTFQQPFLSTWFSITNHFPFDQPSDCPPHIVSRNLKPNDLTVMYTDLALGEYFEKVSKTDWYANTIFMITGDHCFYAADEPSRAMMTNFQVPLLLIAPGLAPSRNPALGCHLNLLPTLIELLRLDTYHASAAVSLFSKSNAPIALNNLMGVVTLATKSLSFSTNFEQVQPCFSGENGAWVNAHEFESGQAAAEWTHTLKALYQVCNNVRINNSLIGKEWMK